MQKNFISFAQDWAQQTDPPVHDLPDDVYCQTRDIFQARLDRMTTALLHTKNLADNKTYLITAIAGEIGNNSFDHNLGNWPDVAGVLFA